MRTAADWAKQGCQTGRICCSRNRERIEFESNRRLSNITFKYDNENVFLLFTAYGGIVLCIEILHISKLIYNMIEHNLATVAYRSLTVTVY